MQDQVSETLQGVCMAWGPGTALKVYQGCADSDAPFLSVILEARKEQKTEDSYSRVKL